MMVIARVMATLLICAVFYQAPVISVLLFALAMLSALVGAILGVAKRRKTK